MWSKLERFVYITENRFGLPDYRLPIVWFDKMILAGGILASVVGHIVSGLWVVAFVMGKDTFLSSYRCAVCGVLLWAAGEYFARTGHRGLIYHHMDLLVDYLDRRITDKTGSG
jgi:hypothetical protein